MDANLICVKSGSLYGDDYVKNLYEGAKRNTGIDFRFHVFTDDPSIGKHDSSWVIHRLPDWHLPQNKAWFYKIAVFDPSNGLDGRNLYIDLDCIILDDISGFWEHGQSAFNILQDFNRVYSPDFPGINSSIMCWTDDSMRYIYDQFLLDIPNNIRRYRGDQDFIQAVSRGHSIFPTAWARSYRWEIWRGGIKDHKPDHYAIIGDEIVIPQDCRIAVFHGRPKPHEIQHAPLRALWG